MASANNTIKTRIQLKSDTEANWNQAGPKEGSSGFIPLLGELIVYTADATHPFSRLKVGDGETTVTALPFIDAGTINGKILEEIIVTAADRYSFPSIGQENKLYVDLNKNIIYCYKPYSGYTQLSHFKYTTTKIQISTVNSWNPGIMTTALVNSNSLIINNGSAPTLDLNTLNVVTDVKEVNE